MKKRHYVLSLLLLLFIAGCERGCTTRHTLDSELKDFTLQGETITVVAQVVDNRNSRAIDHNIFHRSVTHTYSVNISVRYRGQEVGDVYVEGVNDPEKVDLDKVIQRVVLALSKDGNHLAVGVDQKIAEVLHFYKDQPIRNAEIIALNPQEGADWSSLNIEQFPSPRELILDNMLVNCEFFMGDEELVFAFMNDVSPSDTAHRMLLSHWPQCSVAFEFYNEANVRRLRADKTWRNWAEARSVVVLREGTQAAGFGGTDAFYTALKSRKVQELQDSTIVREWGGKGDQHYNELLINRLKSGKGDFSEEKRRLVYNQAKQGVAILLQEGDSDYRKEAQYCLQVLSAMGDTTEAHKVIQYALGRNLDKLNSFDMIEVVFENYSYYTPAQQSFIRSKTDEVFARIPDYARSTLFRAVATFADCKKLKAWLKTYAADLTSEGLPEGC